ncbi:DUF742 domain-containing protein [Streptomyces sp. WMMC897]|uniref:DUF742 domain-containing protein n=1 Tax=Streptomyces sp. WMMC897 TaxID=3014782 RepID=UPI0022B69462|nr:DUF742 domain-containing protein [Streptomyces sp. WMMC897]MCZ7415565.1 DUF742 domain-containing protein [Streptomyces sp. WMMC897]
MTDAWFDDAAGPVVRPYAMTRGRTRGDARLRLDLIALVVTEDGALRDAEGDHPGAAGERPGADALGPEHLAIVRRCDEEPQSVAELAADLDLPVGVVRVLIGDLADAELVRVTHPVPPAELPDESILREVINGLRAL